MILWEAFLQKGRRVRRSGLGLIELLTLVALLAVLLAVVLATARQVRSASASELTRKRLIALSGQAAGLIDSGVNPTINLRKDRILQEALGHLDSESGQNASREQAIHRLALRSNRKMAEEIARLHSDPLKFAGLPEFRDAWGNPIALMPAQVVGVGMAPDDAPFFVSAGPDGRFLTLSDNLYSYDIPILLPTFKIAATNPALLSETQGAQAGQDE